MLKNKNPTRPAPTRAQAAVALVASDVRIAERGIKSPAYGW